jgi:LPXTG-site transpeptidase (sortase) family protein
MFIHALKAHVKQLLLITAFVLFPLFLLFYFTYNTNEKSVPPDSISPSQVINKVSPGLPVRLKIPSINVDAAIEDVGFTSKRVMEVPSNAVNVAWFKLGPRPGEIGSAVIAGHFNQENGEAGVFTDLHKLKKGDKLYIQDDKGTSIIFVVRESRLYNPGLAGEVFSLNDGIARLNLVTCDGVWNGTKKNYSKRLVVFSDIAR